MEESMEGKHYGRFGIMIALSFIAMYGLMYAMVDSFANVLSSLNQVYMAALMMAPMAILEIALMGQMYPHKRRNALIIGASVIVLIGSWTMIRHQIAIDDRQFLRSMIPHHAGALLMCKESELEDPELKDLCQNILSGQEAEIDQMKAILKRLDR